MTPDQQKTIADCVMLIRNRRHSGLDDAFIRAGMISEGWPTAAVNAAFEAIKGEQA